jgi:hypothetical protein
MLFSNIELFSRILFESNLWKIVRIRIRNSRITDPDPDLGGRLITYGSGSTTLPTSLPDSDWDLEHRNNANRDNAGIRISWSERTTSPPSPTCTSQPSFIISKLGKMYPHEIFNRVCNFLFFSFDASYSILMRAEKFEILSARKSSQGNHATSSNKKFKFSETKNVEVPIPVWVFVTYYRPVSRNLFKVKSTYFWFSYFAGVCFVYSSVHSILLLS